MGWSSGWTNLPCWLNHSLIIYLWLQVLCCLTWSETQSPLAAALPACNSCPPGFGVVSVCNSTHDTHCAPCPQGTYNTRHTLDFPCTLCSACEQYEYERIPCTSSADTVCVSCFSKNGGGYGNEDFLKKCESLTTTTTTPPPTASKTPPEPPMHKSTENVVLFESKEDISPKEEETGSGEWESGIIGEDGVKTSSTSTTGKPATAAPTSTAGKATTPTKSSKTTSENVGIGITRTRTEKPKVVTEKLPSLPEEQETTAELDFPEEGGNEADVTTSEYDDLVEMPMIGQQKAEDDNSAGFFQWPVLVAAVVAGVVCFVLGVLISAIVHKQRSSSQGRLNYPLDNDELTTTMITPRQGKATPNSKYPDETDEAKTPIYLGKH